MDENQTTAVDAVQTVLAAAAQNAELAQALTALTAEQFAEVQATLNNADTSAAAEVAVDQMVTPGPGSGGGRLI